MFGFKFIDLFAGIGGMRLAAESNGGECVFSSEINMHASQTYSQNFGETPCGDIINIDERDIPDHDLIVAGFPCQPFSICGNKKGFDDARGTLFYEILRIAKRHNTSVLVLENVKHFFSHDKGNTMLVVRSALEELGYKVKAQVINAVDFGVPQNRDRTIIVASKGVEFDFNNLEKRTRQPLINILERCVSFEYLDASEYELLPDSKTKTQKKSGLKFVGYRKKNLRKVGVRENTEHLSRAHKQPNRIYCAQFSHPTLAAGETSGRYWVLLNDRVRKLTMRECYRLQGFPSGFEICRNKSEAYRQIGNSVPVPMISEVIKSAIQQDVLVSSLGKELAA